MTTELKKQTEKYKLIAEVASAFSPTAPINSQMLFAGRTKQVQNVISALFQRGQHVVMFGERGVGKTSLANVLSDFLRGAGIQSMDSGTINCDSTMNFASLWHKIFRDMTYKLPAAPVGFKGDWTANNVSLDSLISEDVTPDDIRFVLQQLPHKSMIVIDEVDRLNKENNITGLLADTIKTLSDHSVDTTLILVGVADSVDEIIEEHKSVERALLQIHIPRMSEDEIYEILDKSLAQTQLSMTEEAKIFIATLSKGLPHYTHLLGLYSARAVINADRTNITKVDVNVAVKTALENCQQSVSSVYHKAVSSPRDNLYPQVLLACALAETDFLGYFSAIDVRPPLAKILGKKYEISAFAQHLNAFCSEDRGQILQRTGTPRRYKFRFVNPLLQPFVIMKGLESELISETDLDKTKSTL
jgi:Cdc6-like AAA superfamily ATPase